MNRTLLTLAACCLALAPITRAGEPVGDERAAAYREFRAVFDGANYAEALPLAARVVEITRSQYGAEAPELANPLSNLATTYYRMREYGKALDSYREALTLLDHLGNTTDERLVAPLHGMGAALRGLTRDAEAITPLRRAVEIIRNRNGLHAAQQLPLLKELAACYMSTGQYEDAGREHKYAYSVAEAVYGKDDPKLLAPLNDYARWNEAVGRYTPARVLHARAVQIADNTQGANSLLAIDGLRGIARTYRMAYLNGEPEPGESIDTLMPSSLSGSQLNQAIAAQSSEGERALRVALQRAGAASTPQPRLQGEILIDLGDWYLTGGAENRAVATYREAWRALAQANARQLLETPTVIIYRAPQMAVSRGAQDADQYDEQELQLRLAIDANGKVREATVISPVAGHEAVERAVVAAVKRAVWRPVFSNGEPVAANDVAFSERVYVKKPRSAQ